MTDAETAAAIEALAYRLKLRDKAVREGEDYPDAEPFALEFVTALRGQGWRHTEAKTLTAVKAPPDAGAGPSEATRAELEAAKERMDAINAAKRAAREAGAA